MRALCFCKPLEKPPPSSVKALSSRADEGLDSLCKWNGSESDNLTDKGAIEIRTQNGCLKFWS